MLACGLRTMRRLRASEIDVGLDWPPIINTQTDASSFC